MTREQKALELLDILGPGDIDLMRSFYLSSEDVLAARAVPGVLLCGEAAHSKMVAAFAAVDALIKRAFR